MRAAARRGGSMAECARELGVTIDTITWWDKRAALGFVRCEPGQKHTPAHPVVADLAMARLQATWDRVRLFREPEVA